MRSVILAISMLGLATPCPAGIVLQFGDILRGSGVLNDDIVNNGQLIGNSANDPFIVPEDYVVSGAGVFENVVMLGGFAPGNSPGVSTTTNNALAGTLEIEIGGTTPGNGSGNHDQVNDLGTLTLYGAVTLTINTYESFVPTDGDTFTIVTWTDGLVGNFSTINFDPFWAANGVTFTSTITNSTGSGDLTLTASVTPVPEPNGFLCVAIVLLGCAWKRSRHYSTTFS